MSPGLQPGSASQPHQTPHTSCVPHWAHSLLPSPLPLPALYNPPRPAGQIPGANLTSSLPSNPSLPSPEFSHPHGPCSSILSCMDHCTHGEVHVVGPLVTTGQGSARCTERQARGWEEWGGWGARRHEKGGGVRCLQLLISALFPAPRETLSRSLTPSEPQFLHRYNGVMRNSEPVYPSTSGGLPQRLQTTFSMSP